MTGLNWEEIDKDNEIYRAKVFAGWLVGYMGKDLKIIPTTFVPDMNQTEWRID